MKYYYPDTYSILLYEGTSSVKVFAGFYGGFTHGNSWKLSSGTCSIKEITPAKKGNAYKDSQGYAFEQFSGSTYILQKESPPHGLWVQSVLEDILLQVPKFKIISLQEAIDTLNAREW